MTMTYPTYVVSMANLLVVPVSDSNFQTMLPDMINDAELRIQRDLDLISVIQGDTTTFDVTQRYQALPLNVGDPVVVKEVNVITPLGASIDLNGVRNPLTPASNEMITALFPSRAASAVPQYFAIINDAYITVGPAPDAAYEFEVQSTYRPETMSATHTSTFLSDNFPDMLISASMVFAAGYQRNFGAAVDDPKMAVTWESHYQAQLASAKVEEDRKRLSEHGIQEVLPTSQTPRV